MSTAESIATFKEFENYDFDNDEKFQVRVYLFFYFVEYAFEIYNNFFM